MTKRFGSAESHKIKQAIVLIVLLAIISVIYLAVTQQEFFASVLFSVVIILIFGFQIKLIILFN